EPLLKKNNLTTEPRLTIETPVTKTISTDYKSANTSTSPNTLKEPEQKPVSKTTLGALAKIREQVKSNGKNLGQKLNEPIELQKLETAWKSISAQLQAEKNPAYTSFDR